MLDYVSSINQKRAVSRLSIACLALSCFLHFCLILLFYFFPQLLAGGYLHNFRGFRWGTVVNNDDDNERWRMVAILEPPESMNMPSPETLRKILGAGVRDEGEGMPPIELNFNPPDSMEMELPSMPKSPSVVEEPEMVIPVIRPPGVADETSLDAGSSGESETALVAEPGTGVDILAAKPEAKTETQISENNVPQKIPETLPPVNPPPLSEKPDAVKPPPENELGNSSAPGLFNTGGFPMGDYKEIIEAMVRERWLRPSNIKGSSRRTTTVFYINRSGRAEDLRLEVSSGNQSLDSAALNAIWTAAPFPPLPDGFPRERVGVRMILIDD